VPRLGEPSVRRLDQNTSTVNTPNMMMQVLKRLSLRMTLGLLAAGVLGLAGCASLDSGSGGDSTQPSHQHHH
jgi:hypothetical protein